MSRPRARVTTRTRAALPRACESDDGTSRVTCFMVDRWRRWFDGSPWSTPRATRSPPPSFRGPGVQLARNVRSALRDRIRVVTDDKLAKACFAPACDEVNEIMGDPSTSAWKTRTSHSHDPLHRSAPGWIRERTYELHKSRLSWIAAREQADTEADDKFGGGRNRIAVPRVRSLFRGSL